MKEATKSHISNPPSGCGYLTNANVSQMQILSNCKKNFNRWSTPVFVCLPNEKPRQMIALLWILCVFAFMHHQTGAISTTVTPFLFHHWVRGLANINEGVLHLCEYSQNCSDNGWITVYMCHLELRLLVFSQILKFFLYYRCIVGEKVNFCNWIILVWKTSVPRTFFLSERARAFETIQIFPDAFILLRI